MLLNLFNKGESKICNPVEIVSCILPKSAEYFSSGEQKKCNCQRQCSETQYEFR